MPWLQLADIAEEAAALREQERRAPRRACPNDGEPLQTSADGTRFCPFDGYRDLD